VCSDTRFYEIYKLVAGTECCQRSCGHCCQGSCSGCQGMRLRALGVGRDLHATALSSPGQSLSSERFTAALQLLQLLLQQCCTTL
jgi:hypothetical protein